MREYAMRRGNLIVLAVAVLVGSLLPVPVVRQLAGSDYRLTAMGGWRFAFEDLTVDGLVRSDPMTRASLVACAVAIAALIAVVLARPVVRGMILLFLAALFFLLLPIVLDTAKPGPHGGLTVASRLGWAVVCVDGIVWVVLFAGSRGRTYRPASRIVHGFGIVGAVACLAWAVLFAGWLFAGAHSGGVAFSITNPAMVVSVLATVTAFCCETGAAVLCLTNGMARGPRAARARALFAFVLLAVVGPVAGILAACTFLLGGPLLEHLAYVRDLRSAVLVVGAKAVIVFLGVTLLAACGLTDMIVEARAGRADAA